MRRVQAVITGLVATAVLTMATVPAACQETAPKAKFVVVHSANPVGRARMNIAIDASWPRRRLTTP